MAGKSRSRCSFPFKVQRSYPSCTVNVYLSGTSTPATIYSDAIGTPKANPFTAATNGTWRFYAALGAGLPPDTRPLSFGSWIGGDRDGNPYVTATTLQTALAGAERLDHCSDLVTVVRGMRERITRFGFHGRS